MYLVGKISVTINKNKKSPVGLLNCVHLDGTASKTVVDNLHPGWQFPAYIPSIYLFSHVSTRLNCQQLIRVCGSSSESLPLDYGHCSCDSSISQSSSYWSQRRSESVSLICFDSFVSSPPSPTNWAILCRQDWLLCLILQSSIYSLEGKNKLKGVFFSSSFILI